VISSSSIRNDIHRRSQWELWNGDIDRNCQQRLAIEFRNTRTCHLKLLPRTLRH
jgi:hypothetical protein